jgi:phosphatidylglycerol:prolipoprotein diacylglycerol transferase
MIYLKLNLIHSRDMEFYVHNIDPFAIHFWGEVGIRWYGLAYLAGFILGLTYVIKMSKRGAGIALGREQLTDFTTWMAIGTLAGGRVGYAIFYSPDLLTDFSSDFPFWGVFAVHKGGMASHGGITGVMIATVLYARIHKVPILHLIDLTCVGGSLGIFLGRIANFINGELYGRAIESDVAWAVKFPQEMYLWSSKQVSKLFDVSDAAVALGEVEISKPSFGLMQELSLRFKELTSSFQYPKGETAVITAEQWRDWVTTYTSDAVSNIAVNRTIESLILATQSGNQKVIDALSPVLTARHPSQLYQGLMEGLLVFLICVVIWLKPRRPGVIAGWFGFCYLVARIIGEQFRLPDAHLGYQALGLTRGQWISIAYFGVVALLFWISKKQNLEPRGGWSK